MALTQENYLELEGNIQKFWTACEKKNEDYLPKMFYMGNSKRARELHQSFGTARKMQTFNGSVSYDEIAIGYEKEYRHGAKTTGIAVDWRLFEDKEYEEIKKRVDETNYGVYKTLQYEGASVFNNAFDTSVTGPDGQPLCSDSHHLVPDDDTQSNTGTEDMTVDEISDIQTKGMMYKDDRGDVMPVEYDTIICGPYWMDKAKKIIGSTKEAFTADNNMNTQKSINLIVNPWITGHKWFMGSSRCMKNGRGLNFYMRQDPRKVERESDFDALVLKWRNVGRWSYGWDNWYPVYGNNAE